LFFNGYMLFQFCNNTDFFQYIKISVIEFSTQNHGVAIFL